MSPSQRLWLSTGSTDKPISLAWRLVNSGSMRAMYPSSVVQTGVKSFGCENRIAQLSPIHWWKSIFPCVVLAVKFGAMSLMRSIFILLLWMTAKGNDHGPSRKPLSNAGSFGRRHGRHRESRLEAEQYGQQHGRELPDGLVVARDRGAEALGGGDAQRRELAALRG